MAAASGSDPDAVYAGPALDFNWPAEGPKVVWSVAVGEGYANPVVSEGRVIVSHRIGEELVVDCLEMLTGKSIWKFQHAMKFQDGAYFDNGPRPTPSIKNGRVFVHNTDGYLVCLDLKDGKKLWSRHPKGEFKSSGTWHGCVSSPLVTDKAVILQVGATNAGVVAFNPTNGATLWQVLDEKASASSPVLMEAGGKPQILLATRSAFHGFNPDTGADAWSLPTRRQSSGDVYAASPLVFSNYIFLSGWYKLGAQLLQIKNGRPEELWHLDDAISTHYANAVFYEGYLYGFHGHGWERGGPNLRCVELATGKMVWEQPQVGSGTIIRTGDDLIILCDTGEIQVAKASPKGFQMAHRVQVVGRPTRSYPAIADGYVFVKGTKKLVCLDLRAKK